MRSIRSENYKLLLFGLSNPESCCRRLFPTLHWPCVVSVDPLPLPADTRRAMSGTSVQSCSVFFPDDIIREGLRDRRCIFCLYAFLLAGAVLVAIPVAPLSSNYHSVVPPIPRLTTHWTLRVVRAPISIQPEVVSDRPMQPGLKRVPWAMQD